MTTTSLTALLLFCIASMNKQTNKQTNKDSTGKLLVLQVSNAQNPLKRPQNPLPLGFQT